MILHEIRYTVVDAFRSISDIDVFVDIGDDFVYQLYYHADVDLCFFACVDQELFYDIVTTNDFSYGLRLCNLKLVMGCS